MKAPSCVGVMNQSPTHGSTSLMIHVNDVHGNPSHKLQRSLNFLCSPDNVLESDRNSEGAILLEACRGDVKKSPGKESPEQQQFSLLPPTSSPFPNKSRTVVKCNNQTIKRTTKNSLLPSDSMLDDVAPVLVEEPKPVRWSMPSARPSSSSSSSQGLLRRRSDASAFARRRPLRSASMPIHRPFETAKYNNNSTDNGNSDNNGANESTKTVRTKSKTSASRTRKNSVSFAKISSASSLSTTTVKDNDANENNENINVNKNNQQDDVQRIVTIIPNLEDFSTDEKNSMWYSPEEMDATHAECRDTVRSMIQGIPQDENNENSTTRGLEYMTSNGLNLSLLSMEAVAAVLKAQEQLRQTAKTMMQPGSKNDNIEWNNHVTTCLAEVYEPFSRHRARIAHLVGQKDERSVAEQLQQQQQGQKDSRNNGWSPKRGSLRATRSLDGGLLLRQQRRRSSRMYQQPPPPPPPPPQEQLQQPPREQLQQLEKSHPCCQ